MIFGFLKTMLSCDIWIWGFGDKPAMINNHQPFFECINLKYQKQYHTKFNNNLLTIISIFLIFKKDLNYKLYNNI